MQNQYDVILSSLSEDGKNELVANKKLNQGEMNLRNMYNGHALDYFFRLWHKHFPNVRQSKTCKGCRDGVVKFYHGLADLITKKREEDQLQADKEKSEKLEKKNKKTKVKKSTSKK